jgi:hypothetical protein
VSADPAASKETPVRAIESRLNRIVRDMTRAVTHCAVCGGIAHRLVRIRFEDEPERPVEPCRGCGRTPEVVHVVICDGEARPAAA